MVSENRGGRFLKPNCFAQETYEIFGQMKMGPGGACPSGLHGKKAKVKCAEGEIFELPADAMALSLRARKDLLENGCDQELDYPKLGNIQCKFRVRLIGLKELKRLKHDVRELFSGRCGL